ncbi:MAG: TlpA family protein disulfide reductase [SAR202 cluster bacterium]|nr:TlpA family protein disulfide reductase [SAR202 cluster bacterium]
MPSLAKSLRIAVLGALVAAMWACSSPRQAPDFSFTTYQGEDVLGGSELKLSQLQGRPLVLNFWAGLCPPCRDEMPAFQEMYARDKERVLLLGIDVGPFVGLGTRDDGMMMLQDMLITYPTASTEDSSIIARYEVVAMPSTFFITPDGRIIRKWSGPIGQELPELVDELVKESVKR